MVSRHSMNAVSVVGTVKSYLMQKNLFELHSQMAGTKNPSHQMEFPLPNFCYYCCMWIYIFNQFKPRGVETQRRHQQKSKTGYQWPQKGHFLQKSVDLISILGDIHIQ